MKYHQSLLNMMLTDQFCPFPATLTSDRTDYLLEKLGKRNRHNGLKGWSWRFYIYIYIFFFSSIVSIYLDMCYKTLVHWTPRLKDIFLLHSTL